MTVKSHTFDRRDARAAGVLRPHATVRGVRRAAAACTNGIAVAYSQHTSCCVLLQEESEDATYYGTQYILQDTLNVLAKIAPPTRHENQYLHPGPIHIRNAAELRDELPQWGLNTDGHIISSILGRSETVPVQDGRLVLGEFGRVYFGDLDSVRPRQSNGALPGHRRLR